MKAKQPDPQLHLSFKSMQLEHICNPQNELYILGNKIDWNIFEKNLGSLYCENNGRTAKPIRLMVGLHILKAMFNQSDEAVLYTWVQNPYWQYFCGEKEFQHDLPSDFTLMGKWRKKVSKNGFDKILEASIDAAIKTSTIKESELTTVNVDTTVLEKAITYPTDAKLYHKMRENLVKAAKKRGIKLKQTYKKQSKKLLIMVGRYAHARQMKRSNQALRSLKTIFARVLRDLERRAKNLSIQDEALLDLIKKGYQLFYQKREDKNKIYSLHAPEVECIGKGKAHKKYEFGCKISVVTSNKGNFFIGAQALHGNPYDGHTLKNAIKDANNHLEHLNPKIKIEESYVDQGYKKHGVTDCKVTIVGKNQKKAPPSIRKLMRRRSAIEPLIGHAKNDYGFHKNYLKGKLGDEIQALMMAIGFNFRKIAKVVSLRLEEISINNADRILNRLKVVTVFLRLRVG